MLNYLKSLFGKGPAVDYKDLLSKGALIVDVRTPGEYSDGHINQSINIPLNALPQKLNDLKKKNKPIITVCRSGSRSSMAKSMLSQQGIEAYNGGGWISLQYKLN
jgi:rhodanese-related sulfurtransferase